MNKLKVLSIDFDYFQIVDKNTVTTMYPDGLDLATSLTELTWSSYYAPSNSIEDKVNIDSDKLFEIIEILNNQNKDIPIIIANSHKHIYNFILENKKDFDFLDLINIDMHHDMFNDNPEVDCGNWVKHIIKEFDDYSLEWVANDVSSEVYGFEKDFPISHNFNNIKDKQFNLVFICRSDTWLPPHLDNYFDLFYQTVVKMFNNIKVDTQIQKPRDIKLIKDLANQMEGMINKEQLKRMKQTKREGE